MSYVRFQLINEKAKEPTLATEGSVGWDLYATCHVGIAPGGTATIPVGVAIELPPGFSARIHGRSGWAAKGYITHVGVIDNDFRGELAVIVHNSSKHTLPVVPGERVGQLVIEQIIKVTWQKADALTDTVRGSGGFGSTGS